MARGRRASHGGPLCTTGGVRAAGACGVALLPDATALTGPLLMWFNLRFHGDAAPEKRGSYAVLFEHTMNCTARSRVTFLMAWGVH